MPSTCQIKSRWFEWERTKTRCKRTNERRHNYVARLITEGANLAHALLGGDSEFWSPYWIYGFVTTVEPTFFVPLFFRIILRIPPHPNHTCLQLISIPQPTTFDLFSGAHIPTPTPIPSHSNCVHVRNGCNMQIMSSFKLNHIAWVVDKVFCYVISLIRRESICVLI